MTSRERVTCKDCGKDYLRPLSVPRAHGCATDLNAVREALAIRRADLTLLLWWTKRKAERG